MATENQGIMSLPQGGQKEPPAAPQMGLDDSYDAVRGGLQDVSPQADAALQQTLAQITPQLDQLSDEQLDSLIQVFQYLHDHPEEYDEKVKELVDAGVVDAGTMPDKYDPEVLATLMIVFMEAKKQRQTGNQREAMMGMPQPPAGMARGGIADAARMVASKGRSGDSMLAHITPKEAKMLKKHGGVGTINPATGLPEYGFFSSLVNSVTGAVKSVVGAVTSVVSSVVNTVKSVVQSPIGKVLGTIALAAVLGPTALGVTLGGAGTAALASGAITALGGGNLKDVLRSAATSYLGAPGGPVESFLGNAGAAMGVTNAAGQAAINAGLTGAGVGLLTGQSLKDSVKSGLIAGAIQGGITGTKAGFGAQAPGAASAPGGVAGAGGAAPLTPDQVANQINTKDFDQFKPTNTQYGAFGEAPTGGTQPSTGFSRIGGGIMDMAQGNFGAGYESVKGGLGDLYNKISPSAIQKEGAATAQAAADKAYTDAISQGKPEALALKAYDAALKSNTPGVLSSYGPMLGVGLAATGVMGGYKPSTPPPSELAAKLSGTPGEDLIKANPRKYLTQNLPGVQYDSTGNIIGSTPWAPTATMEDIRVPSNKLAAPTGNYNFASLQPPMGSVYTPPTGSLGQQRQIYQPYNTPDMYTDLMPPRYVADGGMMESYDNVPHFFLGGQALLDSQQRAAALNAAAEAAQNVGPSPAGTVAGLGLPAQTQQPTALAGPNTISPNQIIGTMGPQGPVQGPAQGPQVGPPSPFPSAPPSPLDMVRVNPGQRVSMSPQMRSTFAQDFAKKLQYAPTTPVRPRQAVQPQYNNVTPYTNLQQAPGGLASLAEGGYPRRTGQISGPGTEKSDSIPAMLSDGEFVMTAKAVRGAGNGSRRAGAKKMYALMHQLERNASRG